MHSVRALQVLVNAHDSDLTIKVNPSPMHELTYLPVYVIITSNYYGTRAQYVLRWYGLGFYPDVSQITQRVSIVNPTWTVGSGNIPSSYL